MKWTRNLPDSIPPECTRVLVSDGEVMGIASYVESDNHLNWLFDNASLKDIEIVWWAKLPKLPPKVNT